MRHPSLVVAQSVGGVLIAAAALAALGPPAPGAAPVVAPWINEFHYDNSGVDTGEFVEIAGPAGASLNGWRLIGYDAKKGKSYRTLNLSGTFPNQQAQLGALSFAFDGMQDGSPDGLALVNAAGAVVEFLSYEGVFKATNGPALNQQSVDVGVSESGSTPVGYSLQRTGSGTTAADFKWQPAGPQSPGLRNTGQTFGVPDTTPPAVPSGLAALGGEGSVSLDWADNTEADLAGYHVRRGTTSGGPYSQLTTTPIATSAYVDLTVTNGTTYRYVVLAVDLAGNPSGTSSEVSATPQVIGSEFFVAPDGSDANPGTTALLPWQTLGHALPLLGAGDTLTLRAGTYSESGLSIGAAGTAELPITIRNFPGEQPVIDGAYPEFKGAGNQAWELVDPVRSIYRSVNSYPGADEVYGYYGPDNGSWRLVPYEDWGAFSSDNEDYADTPPYYYIGPGVLWNSTDSRIYYRSQRSQYEIADGINVPANADPRQTPLFLFPAGELVNLLPTASHVVLEGLDLRHRSSAIRSESGAHHVTVRNCRLRGGRYQALVENGSHDLLFDGVSVVDATPSWVAWTDVKYPPVGRPGHLFQGSAIHLSDAVDGVEIRNCTLTGLFDAIGASGTPTNLHVHDNLFDARDDVLQLGTAGWGIEFDHNRTLRAQSGGPSWNGSGSAPAGQVGTTYVHHNVIDTSERQRYGRSDPLGLLDSKFQGPAGDGFAAGRAFGSHSKDAVTGPVPWKIYNNTVIVNDDADNGGAGQAYVLPLHDPAVPHEVYNNVFVQLGDEWLLRNARVDDGSQVHDGNLYWAPNRSPGTDLFEDLWMGTSNVDFAALSAFIGSGPWSATQLAYGPGWESSGVEADPQLDGQFQPSPTGPAASGALDLTGKGWPGLAGQHFRGALAPAPAGP